MIAEVSIFDTESRMMNANIARHVKTTVRIFWLRRNTENGDAIRGGFRLRNGGWLVSKYDDRRSRLLCQTGQIRIAGLTEYVLKKRWSLDTVGKSGISVPASRSIFLRSQSRILAGGRIDTRPSPDRQLRRAETRLSGLRTIYPVTLISRVERLTPLLNQSQTLKSFRIHLNSSNLFFRCGWV